MGNDKKVNPFRDIVVTCYPENRDGYKTGLHIVMISGYFGDTFISSDRITMTRPVSIMDKEIVKDVLLKTIEKALTNHLDSLTRDIGSGCNISDGSIEPWNVEPVNVSSTSSKYPMDEDDVYGCFSVPESVFNMVDISMCIDRMRILPSVKHTC